MSSIRPEISFLEFDGKWDKTILKDIISAVGGATPSKSKPDYWDGPIVWLSSQEIKNRYVSNGTYTITHKAIEKNATRIVKKGTPLIVSRSGILIRLFPISIPTKDVAINQDIKALLYDKKIIDTNFLVAQIQSMENFILRSIIKTGTTVQSINMPDFYKLELSFPSKDEQDKIGSLFEHLDDTIDQHRRALVKLNQFKQAMLQKMFPKEGETVPEVRFEGFDYYWKTEIISNITNSTNNLRIPITAIDRNHGTTPYYGANGIQDYVDGYTHKGEYVLLAEDGANDLFDYPVRYVKGKIWVNNHAHVLQGIDSVLDNKFLSYILKSVDMTQYLVGGGRYKLNSSTLKSIELKIPNLEEQERIGNYFYELDENIQSKQAELDKLNQFKQAMLDKMFV